MREFAVFMATWLGGGLTAAALYETGLIKAYRERKLEDA